VSTKELGLVVENGVRRDGPEEGVDRLVALGSALSDPIRVRMLSMMAEGRSCLQQGVEPREEPWPVGEDGAARRGLPRRDLC
jgi:hypothetical protein